MTHDAPGSGQLLALALVAAGILGFEVALTRVIAIQHLHHLAALVIALGLLGFGAAGAFASLTATAIQRRTPAWLLVSAAGFALTLPLSLTLAGHIDLTLPALAWRPEELAGFALYTAGFLVPFFLGALFITSCFVRWPGHIGRLYAADLIGSATGALAVPLALHWLSLEQVLTLCALSAALAIVLLRLPMPARSVGAGLLALGLAAEPLGWVTVAPAAYKELPTQLATRDARVIWQRDTPEARLAVLEAPGLHAAPGQSIAVTDEAPPQARLFFDGDGGTPLLSPRAPPGPQPGVISAAGFRLAPPQPSVVLHTQGSWQAWVAAGHTPRKLQMTTTNGALIELLTGQIDGATGPGYLPAKAMLSAISVRRFHAAINGPFDLVLLELSAPEAGLAAGAIRYDTTVEAFADILADLGHQGVFAVVTDIKALPRYSLRLLATAVEALRRSGRHPPRHVAALRDWRTLVLLVSAAPMTPAQQDRLRAFAQRWRFDLVALPRLQASDSNRFHRRQQGELYGPFQQILARGLTALASQYPYDISATTDDRPFYHRFFRADAVPLLRDRFGPTWRAHLGWGYLLHWGALLIGLLLAVAAILTPLALTHWRPRPIDCLRPRRLVTGLYFSALGLGFMFVEIGLLQKSTLLLDATSTAFSVVVAAMLVGAGVGSYWLGSDAMPDRRLALWLLVPAMLAPLWMVLFDHGFSLAAGWPLPARAGFVALAVFAVALPMGCALPQGMRRLRATGSATIAWAWGVNGFTSVLGSLAAVLIAMHWGFAALMGCASLCYLVAAVLGGRLSPARAKTTNARQ
ncbi:MAG: hypothetical protein R3175_14320 [Marinobacter sp.]|uniref:hypothetical protein n=1 Tax=Marinobacter sp. TaxID=50741 RepID=UPI00299E0D2F|nr:hypothetical protein [Marinobacter sp.]MDX1757228.1 hypothetical protein [Marinobacter sp.]